MNGMFGRCSNYGLFLVVTRGDEWLVLEAHFKAFSVPREIGVITVAKWETEKQLESLLAKYPNDKAFTKLVYVLGDIFRYDIRYEKGGNADLGEASNNNNAHQGGQMSRENTKEYCVIGISLAIAICKKDCGYEGECVTTKFGEPDINITHIPKLTGGQNY
ncbi:hypothetical protein L6452_26349 [Arctium lappa]|uniref:Uncharacterized protein n=1 Tax=Arctium lappa TaxID=4217 RepID=A0ACB9ACN7_ARCLA|nr:hypothetical protein L6452_26349 [Arctium lappa]